MEPRIIHGPKFYNPFKDVSLGQFLFEMSLKHDDKIAQVDSVTDKKESFNSVRRRSVRAAIELSKRGITSNDVVVFCTGNCLDNVVPLLGALYLGAKIASLDPTLSLTHVKHLLSIVNPSMVFVEEKSLGLIEEALENLESLPKIVVFGKSSQYSTIEDFTKPAENEDEFQPLQIDPDDAAILFFSSGTTGLPKVICLSSKSMLNLNSFIDESGLLFKSITHFTTLYWISGVNTLIRSFISGGCRVLIPKFDVEETFRIIEKYKITYFLAAPILLYKLATFRDVDKFDSSSLILIVTGGTPINEVQLIKAHEVFKNTLIVFGYGLTEGGVIALTDPSRDIKQAKLKSCGKLTPGTVIKIVDIDTREILPPYRKGEICVKSPAMMVGYYKTDDSLVYDEEGFLKTGDIGYYDEEECLFIVDRIKEMFKYQSWHIVPSIIENVLLQHPAVAEACVFGLPDEIDGELPAAFVVLKNGRNATPQDIVEFVDKRVLDREKLRAGVKVVESLPKTPSGKLIRNGVRARAIKSM